MSEQMLNRVEGASPAANKALNKLRNATGKVVGMLFYGTLLKSMRESQTKGAYGHGGRGEEVFSAQLHGILAERAGAATHSGLGEALYRTLAEQTQRIATAARLPAQE